MKVQNISSWMIIIGLTLLLIYVGQSIFIPFVIGLLIWFLIKKFRDLVDKSNFLKKYIPRWVKTLLATSIVFTIVFIVLSVMTKNIQELSTSYDSYKTNIEHIGNKIDSTFSINIKEELVGFIADFNFGEALQSLFQSLSFMLGSMVMIIFYVVFLIVEESLFAKKIQLILGRNSSNSGTQEIFRKIEKSMSRYIALKSLVNLSSATCAFIVLLIVGIDSPLFWAFLIFILGFIPSVGPIMATLLPALFSLIQFGEFTPFLIILFGVGTIVMLIGSLLEPRLMGNTLNISPIVAILSLALWGALWGITGMLLSVPITVMLIIILSQFKSTQNIAILLSEKGNINSTLN